MNPENIGMEDRKCHYYAEEQLSSCWEEPDHQKWIVMAEDFVKSCGLENTEDGTGKAMILLEDVRDACKKIAFLALNCPLTVPYITAILGTVMKPSTAKKKLSTTTSASSSRPTTSSSGFFNPKEFLGD